ncbi:MAG TPA: lysophospholipid acyltransferase family protein [Anaeromyxobacteraceae bacterium]|nr:lysophospholipid acyltransferase family protein [Anaeromyxobacteraceae bacterium]
MKIIVPVVAVLAYAASLTAIAIWPPLIALTLAVTWPFDKNRAAAGRLLRLCAAFVSRSFPFWRIRIEGAWPEAKGPYVVVSNHQSFLDIFLISNLPHEMKWIAKKELFRIPWIGWCFAMVGDIALERGDAASAQKVMDKARRYLENGMHVMIFPEGTRSRDGKMLPFKAGAFKLAVDAGVPILPLAVSGSAQGMPKGGPWVRPTNLVLRILEPVPTDAARAAQGRAQVQAIAKLRDGVRERIEKALES